MIYGEGSMTVLGIVALLHLIASHNVRPGELMALTPSNERRTSTGQCSHRGSILSKVLIGSQAVSRPENVPK